MDNEKSTYLSLLLGAPIGCLGGLIGLGGAEFRLPFLLKTFDKTAKHAVALNMAISLITIASSIVFRVNNIDVSLIYPQIILILSIIAGSTTGAYLGTSLSKKISDGLFKKILIILLFVMGVILVSESFFALQSTGVIFPNLLFKVVVVVFCGVIIGIISSLLGVAGGEVIIPVLILLFGLDVKLAGTLSLIISLPTILVGISRNAKNNMYSEKSELKYLVLPMGLSSIIGAFFGSMLVVYAPSNILKLLLGLLLIVTCIKFFTEKEKTIN